jgi:cysteine desulfurase
MRRKAVYLDNHATTPVDPRVLAVMLPYFCEKFGNPSSTNHEWGAEAAEAVAAAREQVAALLGASPREILFTSGATESNNLAIKGVALAYRHKGQHLVTVTTEHKAVLDPCARLERDGWAVTYVRVEPSGLVDPDAVVAAITPQTVLVSVMLANNEIGTIQPLAEIGRRCREHGVLLHSDAAQAAGKIPIDVDELGVDLLSVSAHKMYGPKGVGGLFVRRGQPRVRLIPLQEGGGQEQGWRSGTLATPNIVGFGAACALAQSEMATEAVRIRDLRDHLLAGLSARVPRLHLNGTPEPRLPGNLNVSFDFVQGEALLLALRDVAVSSGSACTTANGSPSHVLKAIGLTDDRADSSLRFGLGRFTTRDEIDFVIARVAETVAKLRDLSSAWQPGVNA